MINFILTRFYVAFEDYWQIKTTRTIAISNTLFGKLGHGATTANRVLWIVSEFGSSRSDDFFCHYY